MDERSEKSTKVTSEISDLEHVVKGALTELTDLEHRIVNIIKPSTSQSPAPSAGNQDSNYLMAIRRFQNAMKVALFDGFNKRNEEIFEEGFNFFENALMLVIATGNQAEIDQVRSEFAQSLIKIVQTARQAKDDALTPYIIKSCQKLAAVYEDFNQHKTALEYHGHVGFLLRTNPLLSNIEYLQAIMDALICKDREMAKKILVKLKLKPYKMIADDIIKGIDEKNPKLLDKAKGKLEVLGAQRRMDVKNALDLMDSLKSFLFASENASTIEIIQVPQGATPLTQRKIAQIKNSLSKGIQHLQEAHPGIKIPVAQVDTESIVSELKQVISSEISKEIKSFSDEIVSKILSNIPRGSLSAPPLRSAGNIIDEGIPDIQVVEGSSGTGEKPKRPRLDDMLDSIIVSE